MSRRQRKKKNGRSQSTASVSSFLEGISEDEFTGPKYEIKVSKDMGRYLTATKDIKPGEIIISEEPLVVGPCTGCKVQCLGCYQNLEKEKFIKTCQQCGWPLCSPKCPGLENRQGHTKIECTILQECHSAAFLDYQDLESLRMNFYAIVPLRCLILKTTDPSSYSILMEMEHHNTIRKNIPDLWNLNQVRVVNKIIREWKLTEFTEEEVHTICGILEVNAFEIGQGVHLRGLYPTSFLLSHDCVPNTNHTDQESTYNLTIRASTLIPTGSPITLSYAYTLQSTQKRREHLLENKFFECHCKRCCDPTELGTYMGALICPKCENGLVLCENPISFNSSWSCTNSGSNRCLGYSVNSKSMRLLVNRISQESELIGINDIKSMEIFVEKYRNVLHPHHYICLGVKISLAQLYGRIEGYLIHELSEKQLKRKKDVCKEVLDIFNVVEPGFTRIRGVTLYEIHAPMMILLNRNMESKNNSMSKNQIKASLKEVVQYLAEAKIILGYEPESSSEGIMGKAAKEALSQIKEWEKIVGKIR